MDDHFKIKKLDAAEMLAARKADDVVKNSDGNFKLIFRYDLSGKDSAGRKIILCEEDCPGNALFRQILNVLPPSDEPAAERLRASLVFVDFSKVFQRNFSASDKTTPSKEDFLHDERTGVAALFDFSDGLELSFDGVAYKTFVPFDKSSNMARSSVISFVDRELKDVLDRRLMLDMDFSEVPVVLSKYYAYRGLYLSSARRIDSFGETDDALLLNQESVIVIEDFYAHLFEKVFTAEENDGLWESCTQEKQLTLNSFDGEGLICPSYAARINAQLKTAAHSFQIRLPFTKGVLHTVDFEKFFDAELDCAGSKLLIEDIFGQRRDLRQAKIILTASMFKCGGWIKKWRARPADPMRYFFDRMKIYGHALYVANTDDAFTNAGKVRFNYQFLSTLELTAEEFDSLVDEQIEKILSVPKNFARLSDTPDDFDDEENFPRVDEVRRKCMKVLARNDAFLKDPKIKTILAKVQDDFEKALCLGKFEVQGEVRFLSGDLLRFLLNVAKKIDGLGRAEKIRELETQTLYPNRFYMPEKILRMKSDKCYVFLRNPHLSRNEQCLLQPRVKADGLYEKYFSQLTGAVMVSCRSTVAMTLGGADFDGDLVKVISDRRIVAAVKRGAFAFDGKIFQRTLPVIEIPSGRAPAEKIPAAVPFRVIENTFANQVGLVSNLAVTLAQKEYGAADPKYFGKCAECTIVVGLEIDAAKNGVHPKKNIERLKSLAEEKSLFLAAKKFLSTLAERGWCSPKVIKTDASLEFYFTAADAEKNNSAFSAPVPTEKFSQPPIELLPVRYLEFKAKNLKPEFKPQNEKFFGFEEDAAWKKSLDGEKLAAMKKLVQAFVAVRRLARKVEASRKWWASRNYDSFADILLKIQYDDPCAELSCGVKIFEAAEQMRATVSAEFKNVAEVDAALKLMREKEWHFTRKNLRAKVLAEILNDEELPPAVTELLSTFRDNGFMLLFRLLLEIKSDLKNAMSNEEFVQSGEKFQRLALTENPFWDELYGQYCRASSEKISSTARDKILASICRSHAEKIFGGDMDAALKNFRAVRAEDSSGNFFWSVFETEEILRNLPKKGGERHAE